MRRAGYFRYVSQRRLWHRSRKSPSIWCKCRQRWFAPSAGMSRLTSHASTWPHRFPPRRRDVKRDGLCPSCHNPAIKGHPRCANCADKRRRASEDGTTDSSPIFLNPQSTQQTALTDEKPNGIFQGTIIKLTPNGMIEQIRDNPWPSQIRNSEDKWRSDARQAGAGSVSPSLPEPTG